MNDGTHISYDEKKFNWIFKVEHFTKYGVDDDDEDDQPMIE